MRNIYGLEIDLDALEATGASTPAALRAALDDHSGPRGGQFLAGPIIIDGAVVGTHGFGPVADILHGPKNVRFYIAHLIRDGEIVAREAVHQGETRHTEFTPASAAASAASFFNSDEHFEDPTEGDCVIEIFGPYHLAAPARFTVEEDDSDEGYTATPKEEA